MIGLTKMLKDGDASIVSICNQENDGGSVDIHHTLATCNEKR